MAQSEQKGRGILNTLLVVMIGQVGCLTLVIIPVSVIVMLVVARKTLARLKDKAEKDSETSS